MSMNIHTEALSTLERITRKFGDMYLHLSGEGKVSFQGLRDGSASGFIVTRFDGTFGCMERLIEDCTCALQDAILFMGNLNIVPNLNLDGNAKYVLTAEEWNKELFDFAKKIEENPFKKVFHHYIYYTDENGKNETVISVVLQPLCNAEVIGEFHASNEAEFLGEVTAVKSKDGFDTLIFSRDKFAFLLETTNDKHLYSNENSLKYREHFPTKGDYLLRDNGTGKLVILPKNDYCGYFH